jgi:ABC-2 type transport system ATP-binding protein
LLTVRENLWMFSQFYGMPSKEANQRIVDLLTMVGLEDRLHTKSSDLSTGLRQKMNIVRGFLTNPEVLFLDEPTLGLDVGAARDVRKLIRNWLDADKTRTLLLTTHYMVEAEELCDRVAIINKGRVLACDTPANLKRNLQRDAIFEIETSPLTG